jgi:anti-sigma B factor antagonist
MSDFAVNRKDVDNISVLNIEGYLDAHTAPNFENAIKQLVDEDRNRIVVNFEQLSYISSAGLGVFMGFIEDIRAKDGDIKMSNMTEKVFKIFDLLGFPSLYDILKEENEAISKFQQV